MAAPKIAKLLADRSWKAKFQGLRSKLGAFSRLFKSKSYASPDDLFFSIEDLPTFGKEYWFLYFCAPPHDTQVILTLGRSVEPFRVNENEVTEPAGAEVEKKGEGAMACAAVCWLYSGKKKVLFDSVAQVEIKRGGLHSISAWNGSERMAATGKYPNFKVMLASKGKTLFKADIFPPKKGLPYEIIHLLKNKFVPRFGAAMINYYFDFKGQADGKPLSGKAYLQKVVAVLPLAPWNWVRIYFESGAVLDFFTGKPLGDKSGLRVASKAYFEANGVQTELSGIKLQTFGDGQRRRWLLTSGDLSLSLQTYSMQPFVMRQKMEFRYDEYLVRVTDFELRLKGKRYNLKAVGAGRGIAEDASGYLF